MMKADYTLLVYIREGKVSRQKQKMVMIFGPWGPFMIFPSFLF